MRKYARVPKNMLCAENPGIKMYLQGVKMDKQREIGEDLLRVRNLPKTGEASLTVILKDEQQHENAW